MRGGGGREDNGLEREKLWGEGKNVIPYPLPPPFFFLLKCLLSPLSTVNVHHRIGLLSVAAMDARLSGEEEKIDCERYEEEEEKEKWFTTSTLCFLSPTLISSCLSSIHRRFGLPSSWSSFTMLK